MLSITELRILKLLFDDLTRSYSILELSKVLRIPYPQTHRNVKSLIKKELVNSVQKTNALLVTVSRTTVQDEYVFVELLRKSNFLRKYKNLRLVLNDLDRIPKLQYICIVFGSYAKGTAKQDSDVDLLFVIPKDYDYGLFERNVKNAIITHNVDINIILDESLHEMWSNPQKLNIGNELLKGHIILKGSESFLEAWRKHNVG